MAVTYEKTFEIEIINELSASVCVGGQRDTQ